MDCHLGVFSRRKAMLKVGFHTFLLVHNSCYLHFVQPWFHWCELLHKELCHLRLDLLICDPLKTKEDKITISYVPCRQSIRFVVASLRFLGLSWCRQLITVYSHLWEPLHLSKVSCQNRLGSLPEIVPGSSVLALFGQRVGSPGDHAQGLRVSDGPAEQLSLAQVGLIKEASLGKSIYFKDFQSITFRLLNSLILSFLHLGQSSQ